jgi:transcriptional regulator with XRE-family HTH domain
MKKIGYTQEWMDHLGVGPSELSRISGVTRTTIANLIINFEKARSNTKRSVAKSLGISVDVLKDEPPPKQYPEGWFTTQPAAKQEFPEKGTIGDDDEIKIIDLKDRIYRLLNELDSDDLQRLCDYLEGFRSGVRKGKKLNIL